MEDFTCPVCGKFLEDTPFDRLYVETHGNCVFCDMVDAKRMSAKIKSVVDEMMKDKESEDG